MIFELFQNAMMSISNNKKQYLILRSLSLFLEKTNSQFMHYLMPPLTYFTYNSIELKFSTKPKIVLRAVIMNLPHFQQQSVNMQILQITPMGFKYLLIKPTFIPNITLMIYSMTRWFKFLKCHYSRPNQHKLLSTHLYNHLGSLPIGSWKNRHKLKSPYFHSYINWILTRFAILLGLCCEIVTPIDTKPPRTKGNRLVYLGRPPQNVPIFWLRVVICKAMLCKLTSGLHLNLWPWPRVISLSLSSLWTLKFETLDKMINFTQSFKYLVESTPHCA